jgi:polyferredoxin
VSCLARTIADATQRMIYQLSIAWCLMASNVAIHAGGIVAALDRLRRMEARQGPASRTWLLVRLAGWIVLLHVTEIMVWALAYTLWNAMPDLPSAMYFSAVTYTTTGYGDLVLPQSWRLVGAVEALTGILMCGWSTGFFFAVLSRLLQIRG